MGPERRGRGMRSAKGPPQTPQAARKRKELIKAEGAERERIRRGKERKKIKPKKHSENDAQIEKKGNRRD
jgi:hypothetical protein